MRKDLEELLKSMDEDFSLAKILEINGQ